jgi:uncharacterized protein YjbJ (UPF0337 family)
MAGVAAQPREHAITKSSVLIRNARSFPPLVKTLNTLPEDTMSSGTTDKIKGATNEAVGKAKRAVGKATGSAKLKRDGDIQEAKGDAQTAMGKVKQALKK